MKNFFSGITGEYTASAKVVDGSLILSLPDALSPIVWRMELAPVKSAALEVRDQKDGAYVLTLKTPRNDVHDIAPFATRGQAVRALMAVSRALENSHGQIISAASDAGPSPSAASNRAEKRGRGRWLAITSGIIVLLILLALVSRQTPRTQSFSTLPDSAGVTSGSAAPNAAGVPVSADDYLKQDKGTQP